MSATESGGESSGTPKPSSTIWIEWARASPQLLLLALILVGALAFHTGIEQLIARTTKLGLGPLSVEAIEQKLSALKPGAAQMLKGFKLSALTNPGEYFTEGEVSYLVDRFNKAVGDNPNVNILWVDDHPSNNREVVDLFETMGFHVHIARSYADAVARFEERSFNAVLSDYNEENDPAQIAAMASGKSYPGVGPLIAEYVGKACGPRTIIFSSGWSEAASTPPYVVRETNNFFDLLDSTADLIQRPIAPECR